MNTLRSSPWSSDHRERLTQSASTSDADSSLMPSTTAWCDAVAGGSWKAVSCNPMTGVAAMSRDGASHVVLACRPRETLALDDASKLSVMDSSQLASLICGVVLIVVLYRHLLQLRRGEDASKSSRLVAIDIFRGISILVMIFVNYGGGGLQQFQHSVWDGLTVADLVFPWFAWIMGVTAQLSSRSQRQFSWGQVLQRTSKLFFLGLILNQGTTWSDLRIPGVLQALSVAYLGMIGLTRLVAVCLPQLQLPSRSAVLAHLAIGILPLVAVSLVVTFALPVPGCPTGYLGPGGDAHGGAFRNCTGGAHLYIDLLVFGERHIFQSPTCRQAFHTGPFDPEGLLNWAMVATTACLGYLAGSFITPIGTSDSSNVSGLVSSGVVLLAVAAAISGGFGLLDRWALIPINKNLWSLSYVLVTTGLATMVFASLLQWVRTNSAESRWNYVKSVGRNSIFIYAMHELLIPAVLFGLKPTSADSSPPPQSLLMVYNVAGVLWWIYVAEWMHERKIFITV